MRLRGGRTKPRLAIDGPGGQDFLAAGITHRAKATSPCGCLPFWNLWAHTRAGVMVTLLCGRLLLLGGDTPPMR